MSNILDLITSQLGPDAYEKIGKQLGTDPQQSRSAVESALPVLLGALARNTGNPEGAANLASALDRDHDGSILNNLDGFLQSTGQGKGGAILGHVLGGQRGRVEQYVSKSSGLGSENTGKLLEMLAPIVLGSLGQQKKSQGLDAGGLAGMLTKVISGGGASGSASATGKTASATGKTAGAALPSDKSEAMSPQQKILASLLDSDKDGDISDDLVNLGGKLLGGFFGRK